MDSGSETFFPAAISKSSSSKKIKVKRRKTVSKRKPKSSSKRRKSASDDKDQAPRRKALGTKFIENRHVQRVHNHPTMTGSRTKTKAAEALAAAKSGTSEVEQNAAEQDKENTRLKEKVARLEQQILDDGDEGPENQWVECDAMDNLVKKTAKTKLFKVCKFVKNEGKLNKATKYCMLQLNLREMADMLPVDRAVAAKAWIKRNRDTVRKALNSQRNYVQQELREWCENMWKDGDKDHLVPNANEMLQMAIRSSDLDSPVFEDAEDDALIPFQEPPKTDQDAMDDKQKAELAKQRVKHGKARAKALDRKRYRGLFDIYVDELVPKMAGHKSWPPSKRHHGTIMDSGLGDALDFVPFVSASDEAMLVTLWENCFPKWWHREECRRKKEEVVEKDNDKLKTPYTDQKGGQAKFGGWKPVGIKRYKAVKDEAKEDKAGKDKDFCQEVENMALKRLRVKRNRDELDANRKVK